MWDTLLTWVDQDYTEDVAVLRARNRSQHAVAPLAALVGVPYAALLYSGGSPLAALVALGTAVTSVAGLLLVTRAGKQRIGGALISSCLFVAIAIVLLSRGGLHSNSSVWLMITPVIGAMTTGPGMGLALGAAASMFTLGLWSAQSTGVVLTSSLDPSIAWLMVAVDHAAVPLYIALVLAAQHSVWKGLVHRLDTANSALRHEVAQRELAEQAAKSAAQARTTFLATMSHEIRTPLNGVLGVTDVILRGPLSPEQRELVSTVKQSGQILRTVLDDVLDFSKIDAGKLVLHERPTSLARTGKDLETLWQARATDQGSRLHARLDDGIPDWVLVDDNRLRQVLGNLLSNAIKYTTSGTVTLRMALEDERIRVSVHDTGVGIDAQSLQRIFDPFQQLDGSDQRLYGGTGLGLAICRRLVARMGGELQVASQPGVGSEFWFTLPLVRADAPIAVTDPETSRASLAGRRVLAAEDNRVNQQVLGAMLARSGVALRMASNGLECIAMCEGELPELILMDCQMPGCDGYDAARRLRASGVEIPIIAVTASTMPGDHQRSLDAGMNEHLTKPIQPAALDAVLLRWLGPDS